MSEESIKLSQRDWIIYVLLVLIVPYAMIVSSGGTWTVYFSVFTLTITPILSILWPTLQITYLLLSYMIAQILRKPEDAHFGSQIQWLTVLAFLWFITGIVFIVAFVESPISYVPVPFVPFYAIVKYSLGVGNEEEKSGAPAGT